MLSKLTARIGLLLDQTSRYPVARVILARPSVAVYRHVAVLLAFSLLGALLIWPIFGADYPPGVDTATFLHLSWVTKLAASGQLADPFQDPYGYGGFSYLVAYPPLGYGLVGVVSFVTGLDFVNVYTAVLVLAYGGLAAATYWLALELGLKRWTAVLAGVLVALAYPVLSSIFLWGRFTSVLAMPFALVGFMLLERALRTGNIKLAVWGGLSMAVSILVHHMTGVSIGLAMAGWFVFHALAPVYPRKRLILYSAIFGGITALVVAPWGIAFLVHVLDIGFRREVPGLWRPELSLYRSNIGNSSLIGEYVYPSYLGITLTLLATGGTALALIERRRFAGLAVGLLVLAWFSLAGC